MRSPSASAALLLAAVAPIVAGCRAQRTLRITSEPTGAAVFLDDIEVGETPLELPFDHYGTRRLTVEKVGYLPWQDLITTAPPWYGRFPLDLVSEVLVPVGWKDEEAFHVVLVEGTGEFPMPVLRSVLERADVLRNAGPNGPRELPTPPEATRPEDGQEP